MQKMLSTERRLLLPVIVAVSLFFSFLEMGAQDCATDAKNRLAPHNAVEIQLKKTEGSGFKAGHLAEFCIHSYSFAPTTFYVSSHIHKARLNPSASATLINARPPPQFHS